MSPNRVYFAFFLFMFGVIAALILLFRTQKAPQDKIATFEDCVKAGYPVMDSYPRQCTLPSGRFFVQQIVDQR